MEKLNMLIVAENFIIDLNNQISEFIDFRNTCDSIEKISNLRRWYNIYFISDYINPMLKKEGYKVITSASKYSFYYMYLLYFIITYKNIRIYKNDLICIDEFQDLSKMEIDLIMELNGNPTLNLFGDFSQRLLSKGTSSESEFEKWYRIYHLKNNYRNTNQITSFYNKQLNRHDNEVGVDGPEVINIQVDDLFKMSFKESDVLICKGEDIKQFKDKVNIKISKIENTKGLEYNTVYVYDKNMNQNERYIAYSRALYQLYVIKD